MVDVNERLVQADHQAFCSASIKACLIEELLEQSFRLGSRPDHKVGQNSF